MILENEIDGLALRTFTDTDIQKLLDGKIGPIRKLTLLIDTLKARQIAASFSKEVHAVEVVDMQAIETSKSLSLHQTASYKGPLSYNHLDSL